jgi:hypothetical protein
MRFMEYSAASALLAGIPRERILNCMGREELLRWVRARRQTAQAA